MGDRSRARAGELNNPDPAVRTAAGEVRDRLAQRPPAGTEVILTGNGLEKYGRLLAKVARASDSLDYRGVGAVRRRRARLLSHRHAEILESVRFEP